MSVLIRKHAGWVSGSAVVLLLAGCAESATTRATRRDTTLGEAGVGALSGAALSVAIGERKADQILTGTAIGAGVGAGVGAYMDAQEEKLARIPGTTVERVGKDTLLVHFNSDILFAIDSATLSWASRLNVGRVADVISQYKKTAVIVQGHTDSTGSEAHNQDLSERRAGSVKDFFVVHGVRPNRLAASGFGERAPVASNATSDGRRQNRRVSILLRTKAV